MPPPRFSRASRSARAARSSPSRLRHPERLSSAARHTPWPPLAFAGSHRPLRPTPSATAVCSINASRVVSFTSVGTCKIDADQVANANWNAAPRAQQSFAVAPALPGPPTAVTATKGNASAVISWTHRSTTAAARSLATRRLARRSAEPARRCFGPAHLHGDWPDQRLPLHVHGHGPQRRRQQRPVCRFFCRHSFHGARCADRCQRASPPRSITVSWTVLPTVDPQSPRSPRPLRGQQDLHGDSASATSCKVTGLTGGRTYTFRVVATNANGPSAASAASSGIVALALTVPAHPLP